MVINNAQEHILKLFVADPTASYNIREIALRTKINYRLVYEAVFQLEKRGILTLKHRGKMNECFLNVSANIPLYAFIEDCRKNDFAKNRPFMPVLLQEIGKITLAFFTAILFGSTTAGKTNKKSDIDILFIIPDAKAIEDFRREVSSLLSVLNYPLDINIIQEKSFLEMKQKPGLNLVQELIPNHIIIFGAEAYFRLFTK